MSSSRTPPQDSITLTGLRAFAHHGVFDFERENGQEFVIDVTVWLDLSSASAVDDVTATVHYGELAEEVVGAVSRDPVDLIETVAERVAEVALRHSAVERVEVTVHKPGAPIAVPFDDVSVRIVRDRDVQDRDVRNPDVQDRDVRNPDVQDPDVRKPDVQDPDMRTRNDGDSEQGPRDGVAL